MLNTSLDIFDVRTRDHNRVDQDLGMLQAIDDKLSIWGWQTGTGTKFAVIVNAQGKVGGKSSMVDSGTRVSKGVGDGDLRVVSESDAGEEARVTDWDCRHSRHYRRLMYGYCKIPSTCRMNIRLWLSLMGRGKEGRLRVKSSFRKSRGLGKFGSLDLGLFEERQQNSTAASWQTCSVMTKISRFCLSTRDQSRCN